MVLVAFKCSVLCSEQWLCFVYYACSSGVTAIAFRSLVMLTRKRVNILVSVCCELTSHLTNCPTRCCCMGKDKVVSVQNHRYYAEYGHSAFPAFFNVY